MSRNLFINAIESNIKDLKDLRLYNSFDGLEKVYLDILVFYCLGDSVGLKSLRPMVVEHVQINPAHFFLRNLYELRLRLIDHSVTLSYIREIQKTPQTHWPSIFWAELKFLCGVAFTQLGQHAEGQKYFLEAVHLYHALGAQKKSVKSLNNYVAAEARKCPDKKLLFDYLHVSQRAKDVNDDCVAGLALFNVSRVYEKLGALDAALKVVQDALALMQPDFGNLHHFMTLAHRAHLLFLLGRTAEAEADYQMLAASEFVEIREIRKVLDYYRHKELQVQITKNELPFLWREKLEEIEALNESSREVLTPLENKVVYLLSAGPKSKNDLIKAVYPNETNLNGVEDRMKQLLARLRKKKPGFLVFEDRLYRLALGTFL